jgi:hypothetical protein
MEGNLEALRVSAREEPRPCYITVEVLGIRSSDTPVKEAESG